MRTIEFSRQFKCDYKREKKGRHGYNLDTDLFKIIELLIADTLLPEKMRDHPLKGNLKDFRDCARKT